MINSDASSQRKYVLLTGDIAVGASKLYADIFNTAGSGYKLIIDGIFVRPTSDVANTGVLSVRMNFFRTSTAGTSGQTVAYSNSSETAASIIPLNTRQEPIPTGISARTIPTGGATIVNRLATTFSFAEETNAAVTVSQHFNVIKNNENIVLYPGEGLLAKQGTVAATGSQEIEIHFTVEELE